MATVIGAMASVASVLLNISPIEDVRDINRTRCVTERSILPYCMMMIDGANWIIYAIMIEDTFPIGVTNTFGFLAGSLYSFVYLRNCWHDKREHVRREAWCIFLAAVVVIAVMTSASIVLAVVWSRQTAVDHVGYVVDVFNVMLYASPLALAWKVLRTGSTSGMYLPLSLTITAAAILWATYGFLTSDWFVAAPQSVGFLAGVAQLLLFLRFGVADNNEPSEGQPGPGERGREGDRDDLGQAPEGEGGGGADRDAAPGPGGGGEGPNGNRPEQPLREPLIAGRELSSS